MQRLSEKSQFLLVSLASIHPHITTNVFPPSSLHPQLNLYAMTDPPVSSQAATSTAPWRTPSTSSLSTTPQTPMDLWNQAGCTPAKPLPQRLFTTTMWHLSRWNPHLQLPIIQPHRRRRTPRRQSSMASIRLPPPRDPTPLANLHPTDHRDLRLQPEQLTTPAPMTSS